MDQKKFLINQHNGNFHLIKVGNKRATRVFSSKAEAISYAKEHNLEIQEDSQLVELETEKINQEGEAVVIEKSPASFKKTGESFWQKIISWLADL
jgi:hypothetical protein